MLRRISIRLHNTTGGHRPPLGPHDVGGVPSLDLHLRGNLNSPVMNRSYTLWELRVHALFVALVRKKMMSADELRRGVEQLDAFLQRDADYYTKWTMSILLAMCERGVFSRREVEAKYSQWKLTTGAAGDDDHHHNDGGGNANATNPFRVGDKVVVRNEAVHRLWRRPHLRVPGFLGAGSVGVVTEILGRFYDPSYAAFRDHLLLVEKKNISSTRSQNSQLEFEEDTSLKQPLYRVQFNRGDIQHYAPDGITSSKQQEQQQQQQEKSNEENFVITLDIFQPWLLPGGEAHRRRQLERARDARYNVEVTSAPLLDSDHHNRSQVEQDAIDREGGGDGSGSTAEISLQNLSDLLVDLLVEKGVVTKAELDLGVKKLESLGRSDDGIMFGARLVARAWKNDDFKQRLLADATAAARELKIETSNYTSSAATSLHHPSSSSSSSSSSTTTTAAADEEIPEFPHGTTVVRFLENTPTKHNLVCCTLCSCWPAALLGLSPPWYKSRYFRSQAVLAPRALLKEEFALEVPKEVQLHVHDSTAEARYVVLPMKPAGRNEKGELIVDVESMSEEELARNFITRDMMTGTAVSPN